MLSIKKISTFAQQLLKHSLDSKGLVSPKLVQVTLQTLKLKKPANHLAILKSYKFQVLRKLQETTALVEYSGCPSEDQISAIQKLLSKKYNRHIQVKTKENPSLLAGIRVSVADDVYESSANGRLGILAKTV